MNKKTRTKLILIYIIFTITAFITVLAVPVLRDGFKKLSSDIPYVMGFIKFSLLATAGELIASAIAKKEFDKLIKEQPENELIKANQFCFNHQSELTKDKICGCFFCD